MCQACGWAVQVHGLPAGQVWAHSPGTVLQVMGAARAAVVTGGDVAGISCGHLLRSGQRRDDLDEDGPADDDGQFAAQGGGAKGCSTIHVGDGAGGDAVERDVVRTWSIAASPASISSSSTAPGSAASSLQAGSSSR